MRSRHPVILFSTLLGCTPAQPDAVPPPAPAIAEADSGGSPDAGSDAGTPDSGSFWPDLSCLESKMACGRCGEQQIMCIDGKPTPGTCMGEHGECDAGQIAESADKCSTRTCKATCVWGSYTRKPSSQCGAGESRSCATNPATCGKPTGVQECMNCKWTACLCK